jgi:hypothetical protein
MRNHYLFIYASLSCTLLASGCVATTPRMDSKFGDSVNIAKAQQTINTDASANKANTQIDGNAAKGVYDNFQKGIKTPEKQPSAFTIGVGGG